MLDEEDAGRDFNELQREFDYDGWIERSTSHFRDLFVAFATAHRLGSGLKTVKHGSSAVCANGVGDIDEAKAQALKTSIYDELTQTYGEPTVLLTRSEVECQIDASCCFISTYVSGKDFFLPLMVQRLRAVTKTKAPNLNLKLRFARKCDVAPLREIVDAIGRIVRRTDLHDAAPGTAAA